MALSCPVCAGGPVTRKLRKDETDILQCRDCGLAFWQPAPGWDAASLYDGGYFEQGGGAGYDDYGALEPALRRTFRRRIARLARAGGGRLLDVGAAYGFAASEAEAAGFRVAALEVSTSAARRAAALVPGRVAVAGAEALPFASGAFDVVTLWDVLEHLPDPHRAMAEVARCLRLGGRVALTTGDVGSLLARLSGPRWHLYTLPEHLFFHSRESLRRLLSRHGLRVERMRAEGALYPVGYLVERLRKTLLRRDAPARASWPGADLVLPVNLFDILTVEAVREPARVR